MVRKALLYICLFVLSCAASSFATVRYSDTNLSADCSGNYSIANRTCTGSDGDAYNTIQEGVNVTVAGDTLYVRAGTYAENITGANQGTESQRITFQAYNGETVTIDGAAEGTDRIVYFAGHSYMTWDGIDVINGNNKCAWFKGTRVYVKNSVFHDCGTLNSTGHTCLTLIESSYGQITGNETYNCGWNGISVSSCNYTEIDNNISRDSTGHMGIQITQPWADPVGVWVGNNIRNNTIYNTSNGIYSLHQRNNVISGNIIYENQDDGILLDAISGGAYDGHTRIINNTIIGNGRDGISNRQSQYMTVENNIINGNGEDDIQMSTTTGHTINYNMYNASSQYRWSSTAYTSLASWQIASSQDSNSSENDPLFTNAASDDYTLQSSSPAIDASVWAVATANSGSGTQIQLTDSVPFFPGDVVQLQGQSATATVVANNTSTNVLSVNNSLTWGSGVGLWHQYSGSKPDIGYDEYDSAPPSSDPTFIINDPTSSPTFNTTASSDSVGGNADADTGRTIASVGWACPECPTTSGACTADDALFDEEIEAVTCSGIDLSSGTNTITITATDDLSNTGTDIITIYRGQEGVIEAESCTLASNMTSTADASASGGYYISTSVLDTGTATCSVVINTAGYYKFFGKVYSTGIGDNSFFVTVDEAASTSDIYAWDINAEGTAQLWSTYYEEEISKRGAGTPTNPEVDPLIVYLTADTHQVIIGGREVGARLDYIYAALAPNPNTSPEGTITVPTTLSQVSWDSTMQAKGSASVSGASLASAAYAITCNGAPFDSGSLTADDAAWDEAAETWTLNISGMPVGECVLSVNFTDSGANVSDAELLTITVTTGRTVGTGIAQ